MSAYVPAAQGAQAADAAAPVADDEVPGLQAWHVAASCAPTTAENVPGEQGVQAVLPVPTA